LGKIRRSLKQTGKKPQDQEFVLAWRFLLEHICSPQKLEKALANDGLFICQGQFASPLAASADAVRENPRAAWRFLMPFSAPLLWSGKADQVLDLRAGCPAIRKGQRSGAICSSRRQQIREPHRNCATCARCNCCSCAGVCCIGE